MITANFIQLKYTNIQYIATLTALTTLKCIKQKITTLNLTKNSWKPKIVLIFKAFSFRFKTIFAEIFKQTIVSKKSDCQLNSTTVAHVINGKQHRIHGILNLKKTNSIRRIVVSSENFYKPNFA